MNKFKFVKKLNYLKGKVLTMARLLVPLMHYVERGYGKIVGVKLPYRNIRLQSSHVRDIAVLRERVVLLIRLFISEERG